MLCESFTCQCHTYMEPVLGQHSQQPHGGRSWTGIVFSIACDIMTQIIFVSLSFSHQCLRMLVHWSDSVTQNVILQDLVALFRADSRFIPSQWETVSLCNDISHWLDVSLQSTLLITRPITVLNLNYVHGTIIACSLLTSLRSGLWYGTKVQFPEREENVISKP